MSAPDDLLPPSLPPGPCIVGATGGSGTRAVARLLQQGGMWIGAELNESSDALPFGLYSNRWIDPYLGDTHRWRRALSEGLRQAMLAELRPLLAHHLAPLTTSEAAGRWLAWGWKEPRSMYLLPFWHELFPQLRFLHLVRDGRDMALSTNQNQLLKHGTAMLGPEEGGYPQPVRSLALWVRANTLVANFGERVLGPRYLRLRYEDLCAHPPATAARVFAFFGLPQETAARAATLVAPPPSLGRWRQQEAALQRQLRRLAASTLARFGYPVSWLDRLLATLPPRPII